MLSSKIPEVTITQQSQNLIKLLSSQKWRLASREMQKISKEIKKQIYSELEKNLGIPILHLAIRINDNEMFAEFLEMGSDKESLYEGMTPLHCAIANQDLNAVKKLIENGANQMACYKKMTPYEHALELENEGILELLKSDQLIPPIHAAIQLGNIKKVKKILEEKIDLSVQYKGKTPLESAIERRDFDIARLLLREIGETKPDDFLLTWKDKVSILQEEAKKLIQSENDDDEKENLENSETKKIKKTEKKPFSIIKGEKGGRYLVFSKKREEREKDGEREDILGKGAFGTVKLVQELKEKKWYAVKVNKKTSGADLEHEKYMLEKQGLLKDTQVIDDKEYIFMHCISGMTLKDFCAGLINGKITLSVENQRNFLSSLISLGEKLSASNIIHFDIHEENIMINPSKWEATALDFEKAFEISEKSSSGKAAFIENMFLILNIRCLSCVFLSEEVYAEFLSVKKNIEEQRNSKPKVRLLV